MGKKYGLPTAICMVVGIVIGSGVFFKAEKVLQATGGNMPLGIPGMADRGGHHDHLLLRVRHAGHPL